MLGIVFGWRKASKCKKLIRQALGRLKLLKNKRYSIIRQFREDLAELIENGHHEIAFNRVEQLIRDERLMEAYELIENFCEFILVKLSYIRKHKNCPDDIIEAISSVVYASARFGDFPELKMVRELFSERYGPGFVADAVELCPGNLVNPQIIEKFLMKPISDDQKQRLINEMVTEFFHPAILALEYCPDWHQKQVLDVGVQTLCYRNGEAEVHQSNDEVVCVNASFVGRDRFSNRCQSATSCSPNLEEITVPNDYDLASQLTISSWKTEECQIKKWIVAASLDDKLYEENVDALSCERSPPFSDETIVYLDDVVELRRNSSEDRDLRDHRLFKFKSPIRSKKEEFVGDGFNQSCEIETMVYDVFIYSYRQSDEIEDDEINVKAMKFSLMDRDESSLGSYEMEFFCKKDEIVVSNSSSNEYETKRPNHVHPKLPDCDEIVAKFAALKREHQQKKNIL